MPLNIFDVTRSRVAISGTPMDNGAATMFSRVSASLDKAATDSFKEWEDAVVKQETKAGELEGAGGDPQYKAGNNLAAEAYNAAAKKSYVTNLETKAASAMGQFAEQYKNDPIGYQKATTDYMTGLTQELKSKSQTAGMADLFAGRLALDAQSQQYAIQKRQAAIQKEQAQADNENLYMTIKNNAYREAGGVFSKDETVQKNTLMQFHLSRQALDSSLNAVLPDGTPVYSPKEKQAREEDFFRSYYTQAAKNYVTQGNPSAEDLSKLMDGTMEIDVPGLGKINLLDNIGADRYDKDVVNFITQKENEKEAAANKARVLSDRYEKEAQEVNGLNTLIDILNGKEVPMDKIVNDAKLGRIKPGDAASMMKLVMDPNTGVDDPEYVANLSMRAARGEDVAAEAKRNAYRMTGSTFEKILDTSNKAQKGLYNDNKNALYRQLIKKDQWGFEDPDSVAKAYDIQLAYDQMIKDKMDPTLAYEKCQAIVDKVKGEEKGFSRVPKYIIVAPEGVDLQKTYEATEAAFTAGKLSVAEYEAEMAKLDAVMNEKGANK